MKIIYTAIFGSYDRLQPIMAPGWKCICFTDGNIKARGWEVVKMEPYAKAYRHIKTCPHLFLPLHEKSIWIDGNIAPKGNINWLSKNKTGYWLMEHPHRDCIYSEGERCIALKKDNEEIINSQLYKYRSEGYPDNNGLVATGVIMRTSGYEDFNEAWWEEIKNHSVRDQLSFNYVAHKHNLKYKTFPFLKGFTKVPHA